MFLYQITEADRLALFEPNLESYVIVASMLHCHYCRQLQNTLEAMADDLNMPVAFITLQCCNQYAKKYNINAFPHVQKFSRGISGGLPSIDVYRGNRSPKSLKAFFNKD